MAWEDRTPDEKKARTEARRYRATDDDHLYEVTVAGARFTVRVTRAGHRRWVLRRQRADWQPPAGAITDRADRVTLADLLDNKEASVR